MSQEYKMSDTDREKQRQRMAIYRAKKRAEKATNGVANKATDGATISPTSAASKKKTRAQKIAPTTRTKKRKQSTTIANSPTQVRTPAAAHQSTIMASSPAARNDAGQADHIVSPPQTQEEEWSTVKTFAVLGAWAAGFVGVFVGALWLGLKADR